MTRNTSTHCAEHRVDLLDPDLHYGMVPHLRPCYVPRHWHVIENTPGYMPDSDPGTFSARRDAVRDATALARELREDGYHGRTTFDRDGYGYLERDARDLGRVITIEQCAEGCES
jgi:hypothetical protein